MRIKFVSIFAALLLVAACETPPEETADSGGEGTTTEPTTTATDTTTPTTTTTTTTETTPEAAGIVPGSQEDLVVNVGDRIFFDFDKAVLKSAAQRTLTRQAEWMKQNSNVMVTVEGHADERGTREYNLALGERRATAVKNFLVALGVSPSRIATISYGKERPAALGHNDAAWSQNRRGVTVVN
jgi:peptidoglycan-associated lipoprotein